MDFEVKYLSDTQIECWFFVSPEQEAAYFEYVFPDIDWDNCDITKEDTDKVVQQMGYDFTCKVQDTPGIQMAGHHPYVRAEKHEPDDDLYLVLSIDIVPEVKLPDYRTIAKQQQKASVEATEEDFRVVKDYFLRLGVEYQEVDRPCQIDDIITVNYTMTDPRDGTTREGTDIPMHLGEDGMIPGLDEEIIGGKKYQTQTCTLTEDAEGNAVTGSFEITSIKEPVYPESDFIRKQFPQGMQTEENVNTFLWFEAYRMRESEERKALMADIIESIEQYVNTYIPESMIHAELAGHVERLKKESEFGVGVYDLLESPNEVRDMEQRTFEYGWEKAFFSLITQQIAKHENLYPTEEEIQRLADHVMTSLYPDTNVENIPVTEKREFWAGAETVLKQVKVLDFLAQLAEEESETKEDVYRA